MAKDYRAVGRVTALFRYPVKSMQGEPIAATKVGWHGFGGDRRYAWLRLENLSGLPWLSGRELPQLAGFTAQFVEPENPDKSPIVVTTPAGCRLDLGADELLAELEGLHQAPLRLTQLWRGTFDSMPLSLISTWSIAWLETRLGCSLDVARFRPNVLVEPFEDKPFPEDRWLGDLVVFGDRPDSARIRVSRQDPRCSVVNINPTTLDLNPAILKEIVTNRKNQLGVYATTERPGTIQVGDVIRTPVG